MTSDLRTRRLLACLGDPSRFRVVSALASRRLCVTELAAAIGLSQSCTTRHLQALVREGVAVRERDGRRVLFRIRTEEDRVASLVGWALGTRNLGADLNGYQNHDSAPTFDAEVHRSDIPSISDRPATPPEPDVDDSPSWAVKSEMDDFLL